MSSTSHNHVAFSERTPRHAKVLRTPVTLAGCGTFFPRNLNFPTRRPALTTAAPFTIYEEPAHRTLEAGGHVCNAISIHAEVLTLFSPPLLRPGFLTFTFSTCGTGRRNIYIKIQPNSLLMHVAGRSGASRMHMDGNLYSLEVQSRCAAVRMLRFLG